MPQDEGGFRFVGAVAGVGSGLTKVAVGHGFDTIKTRLQCAPPGMYAGAWDCLKKTVQNESILALYKGASPPAVGWAAIDSLLLGSLHNYRLFLFRQGMTESAPQAESGRRLTILGHGIAGLFAGCTSAVISHPVELVKVKLQLQRQRAVADREFKGPIDTIKQVVRAHGVQGIYRGFGSSLIFRSSFFWMFGGVEVLMRSFSRLDNTPYAISNGTKTFLSGGLASFVFWFFAIPADNVKNRILTAPLASPRLSPVTVARHIFTDFGWKGFYRGIVPCTLRAFPVNAAAYAVYEGLMGFMNAEQTRA